ncbi:PH domain-containing protein [Azohydromonas caseinilytica]|uniref:PH domain-containing protein n=1 Tax=Azohydromonas caseinilytica TaxID=2728836 RepID=A0A848FFJ9_9BURK|nr:PH domain-containing protein [Azohydromonas caseinilytica]NML19007.1 PH domain-containing protein [Azohydromonas caseinilytica]
MGLLNLFTDTSSAIRDMPAHDANFANVLFEGESLEAAFRMLRDYVAFTSHRIIVVDKQGMTGRKRSYLSVPYGRILAFSSETKGTMDMDSELTLHVQGLPNPVKL